MLIEILRAIIVGGVPVAVFTFLVVQWAIASGRMDSLSGTGDLQKQHSQLARQSRENRKKRREGHVTAEERAGAASDLVYDKLLFFGGGYYGTMAALTYVLIECVEIWNFLLNISSPDTWFNHLGLALIIELLVNSLMNIAAAFVWFGTLQEYIHVENGWVWLAVTYAAYWLALRFTLSRGDLAWERLKSLRQRYFSRR